MTRDFTEENKQKLLGLVKEVEPETWYEVAGDWVGDRWLDFEGWIGALDIQNYITEVDKYHKKVIDKNNTTEGEINKIFTNVNNINTQYVACFASLLTQLRSYTQQIANLAITIDPANGVFNSEFIGSGLKRSLDEYIEKKAFLDAINSDEGMNEETLKELNIDNRSAQELLEMYCNAIIENMPSISIGDELQVPIGPGMVFYYKVSGKVKGEGNFDLNYVIEDQKIQLKKYGYKTDDVLGISAKGDSDGNVVVSSSDDHSNASINWNDGTLSYSYNSEFGNNKYDYTFEFNPNTGKLKLEETVTTEIEDSSISSTIGIKKSENINWQPMPEPVPITSPYEVVIPDFDISWETVGSIVVVAGVTYVVVKTVAGLALAPYTGGLSLGLVVV